jgi:hypothetical protein
MTGGVSLPTFSPESVAQAVLPKWRVWLARKILRQPKGSHVIVVRPHE